MKILNVLLVFIILTSSLVSQCLRRWRGFFAFGHSGIGVPLPFYKIPDWKFEFV